MANVLGKALKTDLNKPPAISAGEDYMKSVEPTLKELKGAEEQKLKFEKEKSIQTAESEAEKAKSFSSAKEGEIKSLREDPARAELEGLMGQKAKAEFIPTQENAKDMATLFSLMNVIGFAIGAGGKQHSQQAMSAMNGMLEGHQKGRDDLYRQERNIFDINQKLLDKKIDGLFKFMQENSKLYTKDKELAEQNAMVKFAEEGAGFLKAYYEKNGPGPTLEYMKQLVKAKEHAADLTDKEKTRAENERFRLQQSAIQAEAKLEAAREKAAAKTDKATQQQFIVQRSVNALGGVASAVESLNKLPAGTTAGILPNLTTKDGMFNYIRNAAGRTMSKSEEKAVETLFTGITRNLAAIEASGAATGLTGLSTQLEKLRPVAGDKAIDVALKMADIRRIATENVQPLIDSGLMPKQQAETARMLVNRISKAIPYTTDEVVTALSAGKGKETMGEAGARIANPPKTYSSEADAEAAFKSGNLKSGEKVIINGQRGTWE